MQKVISLILIITLVSAK